MQNVNRGRAPPPAPQRRTDRRVQRTRDALRAALLALLPERGWDAIDVQTLCERANVGRSTFYLHFPDKTALLRGAFEDLRAHLLASTQGRETGGAFPFLPGLLEHVHEQSAVFQALAGRRSSQTVQDHFREVLVQLFSEARGLRAAAPWAEHARAQALAGALFQLLVWWLSARRPLSPPQVEAWFLEFAGEVKHGPT